MDLVPGAAEEAYPVKPIESLENVRQDILDRIENGIPKILVIGAGPAGVELAGNIWRLVNEHNRNAEIILASSRDDVLPSLSEKVRSLAHESLVGRGIRIVPNFRAASMNKGSVLSQSGDTIAYDIAVLTIGIMPKQIFNTSGLETAADGSLMVNDYLQSISHPEVFGGGDCITVKKKHLDRVGVYAVREAPVIFNNLMACLKQEPIKEFSPQQQYLLIFNLGDGNGIFVRHPIVIKAKWAFTLKDYIDRRFMSMFQVSGEAQESPEVSP
jgi:NADH dehydrogenase FAD-containing subunit